MQKVSIRKLSVLGLVLMAASAVTAAVIPNRTEDKRVSNNDGTLRLNSAGNGAAAVVSCIPDVDVAYSCTASSQVTITSAVNQTNSYVNITDQTVGNTSQTLGTPDVGGVDQTSDVQ